MPDLFKPFRREKSLAEIEEDTEREESKARLEDAKYSVAEKKAMTEQLKRRGLSPEHFKDGSGGESTWKKIYNWLKTH